MNLEIRRPVLAAALGRVQRLVGRKTVFPVTRNALLTAMESGLTLQATDLETGFLGKYSAEVTATGVAMVPGRALLDIVQSLSGQVVSLQLEKGDLVISAGAAVFRLPSGDVDDFPSMPEIPEDPGLTLPGASAARLFDRVALSANVPPGEQRVHLRGVLLEAGPMPGHGGMVRLVNTDGNRLAMAEEEISGPVEPMTAVLQKLAVPEFASLVDGAAQARLVVSGVYVFCQAGPEALVSRTLEGVYPDYRIVIPPPADGLVVSASALSGALRRVGLFNARDGRGVTMRLAPGRLELSVANAQVGDARESVPVEYAGPPVETVLATEYLRDAVAHVADGNMFLQMPGPNAGAVIRHADPAGYTAVVMPFAVEE